MTPALDWRWSSKDGRTAQGRYNWHYELVRQYYVGTRSAYWVALFYDGTDNPPQKLDTGNFIQARKAAISHHNHLGY